MPYTPAELWEFLPVGYLFTILIETPVLMLALSRPHPWQRRLFSGIWLTACTYPVVVLVLPLAMQDFGRASYLWVAETFAPAAEIALFATAFWTRTVPRQARLQDALAILLANLASFGLGLLV